MVILFDRFNLGDDIYEIIFSTNQQVNVSKALIKFFKDNTGTLTKTQMSLFASSLHEGDAHFRMADGMEQKLTYNKRQFYDRILTPLKTMGIVDYDMYQKVYRLSDAFNKEMVKIGKMWLDELERPP